MRKGLASKNLVSAIGFYGDKLKISCGSLGGWEITVATKAI
ncbi:MAG: hypothetical protein ACOVK9_01510 [Bacteroidia bacterium]